METNNLTIAINVDDILLNRYGKLQPEALKIFAHLEDKANFIFLTNGSANVAFSALAQINEKLNKQLFAWVIANGGSQIFTPNNRLLDSQSFDVLKLWRLISYLRAYDNDCMLQYCTENGNFVDIRDNFINNLRFYYFKKRDLLLGNAKLDVNRVEGMRENRNMKAIENEIGPINQLVVQGSDKKKYSSLRYVLRNNSKLFDYYERDKKFFVPARNKLSALQTLLESAKSVKTTAMSEKEKASITGLPSEVSKIIYIGNSVSDVECLRACDISVAHKFRACSQACDSAKYSVEHLGEFIDYIVDNNHLVPREQLEESR